MGTCVTCGANTQDDNEECRDCGGGDTDTEKVDEESPTDEDGEKDGEDNA